MHLQATVEVTNLLVVAEMKDLYSHLMDNLCDMTKPILTTAQLEMEHDRCKQSVVFQFEEKVKIGGTESSQIYKSNLIKASISCYYF